MVCVIQIILVWYLSAGSAKRKNNNGFVWWTILVQFLLVSLFFPETVTQQNYNLCLHLLLLDFIVIRSEVSTASVERVVSPMGNLCFPPLIAENPSKERYTVSFWNILQVCFPSTLCEILIGSAAGGRQRRPHFFFLSLFSFQRRLRHELGEETGLHTFIIILECSCFTLSCCIRHRAWDDPNIKVTLDNKNNARWP